MISPARFARRSHRSDRLEGHRLEGHRLEGHRLEGHRPEASVAGASVLGTSLVFFLLSILVMVPCAAAEDLGFFESRSLLSDADDALEAGRLDQASELYARVVNGTEAGKKRHARALLGAALAELSQEDADVPAARGHLQAYLDSPEGEEKATARALLELLSGPGTASSEATPPPPPSVAARDAAAEPSEPSPQARARIAKLERELATAREEIEQKEKVIEELRKIVVEGGG